MRHAIGRARSVRVADDLEIPVATVSTIALLKMVSYLDRPHDRDRDLGDLAYVLEHYAEAGDDRRFSSDVLEAGVTYEQTGAFLLGRDLRVFVDAPEREAVERFMSRARGEGDAGRTLAVLLQQAPPGWRRAPAEVERRLSALSLGIRGD
jgi:predicted nucleotidyltransferase